MRQTKKERLHSLTCNDKTNQVEYWFSPSPLDFCFQSLSAVEIHFEENMAASLVGGALLSATLQVVFDRLASREVVDYLRGKRLSDELINNLKTVLSTVNAVLDDAEEKQITKPNVKQWLDELEDASLDADDLLDEIATDALQSKLEAGSGTSNTSCKKLKMLPEQMHNFLPSLQYLWICNCPEVESFPEGGVPSNLDQLYVLNCSKLIADRMKWNLQKLQALTYFAIKGVESFPEEGLLPSTLERLFISRIGSLKRLELTSLTSLLIQHCPQLHKLPEKGLPTSLTSLNIRKCPLLKERCQKEKGQDWAKISHIPRIEIDGEYI